MNEKQLTKQEVFNLAFNFYKKGGEPGYVPQDVGCVYFGDHGERCAWGVLLGHLGFTREDLDTEKRDYNEGTSAEDICTFLGDRLTSRLESDVYETDRPAVAPPYKSFCLRIQRAHDYAAEGGGTSEDVCESLREFAQEEGLQVSE